jgi:predicted RNA-binding Zn ribbon-like protein
MTTSPGPVTSPELLGEPLPVELMNTINWSSGAVNDVLASPAGAAAWVDAITDRLPYATRALVRGDESSAGGVDESAVGAIVGRLRGLRDALRRLAAEVTGDPRPPETPTQLSHQEAVDVLNHLCALHPAWPEVTWPVGGTPTLAVRSPGPPAERIVGEIAEQAAALFTGDQRDRLTPCLAPGCDRYFLKARPRRQWCSATCGNRARVARHYQRHRGPDRIDRDRGQTSEG